MIIGSYAIKYHFLDFPRTPKDIDIIKGSNFNDYFPFNLKREYLKNDVLLEYKDEEFLNKDSLYTLKVSHLFWDINWEKHIWDAQWLKNKGCVLNKVLFHKLYEYWNTVHKKNQRSNLDMSSEDFFDNAISCEYSHDWLHTLINKVPTYTKVLADDSEVLVSEDKFNLLTYEEKCDLVKEEVYVMAYERFKQLGYKRAYNKMLKKFIINHAPLWEAVFIIENYKELQYCNINFIKLIDDGINNRTN